MGGGVESGVCSLSVEKMEDCVCYVCYASVDVYRLAREFMIIFRLGVFF